MNALKLWWHTHVQKTLGSLLAALAGVDLVSALAGFQADITAFLGAKVYAALRCACGLAIVIRAVQAKRAEPLPAPAPEATR
jgi:hypothetical protein